MKKLLDKHSVGMSALALAIALCAGGTTRALAQESPKNGWFKICTKQEGSEFCNVQYQAIASNGQVVTSVNLADIKAGKNSRRIFQVTVPTGRLLPEGVKLRVNDKDYPPMPYIFCFQDRCAAEGRLDDKLVGILKSGKVLTVTSINVQGKPNPIQVSLEGFGKAYDGPPIEPDALAARSKKLQEELQKKAEEDRSKLQAAQDAAKKN